MKLKIKFPTAKSSDVDEAAFKAARKVEKPGLGPEAQQQDGVPIGKLTDGRHEGAEVYPGVTRDYWTYVPEQYDGKTPTNLIVFQDGRSYLDRTNAATVLDNLIAKGDLVPTIAVFIQPGELSGEPQGSRGNRSLEYDNVNDAYVRFLLGELLPEAIGKYSISDDPSKRAIIGMSSGGICAFNAAWERPDQFGLVVSHVGSFTNIRGGNCYPSRIRQNGKKPIRVFMQDGSADNNHWMGNWPIANFDVASSLKFREYDMRFEFGVGAHDFTHPGAILPETLRWIFRS